jgi:sec-independent protein translocase protein TatC
MASETEEPRPELDEENGEGGPVKTFLEHLEDLRWVLIKSLSFLGVAVVVCLLGGSVVVKVLMRPLENAKPSSAMGEYISESSFVKYLSNTSFGQSSYGRWLFSKRQSSPTSEVQRVSVFFATNHLGTFSLTGEERTRFPVSTNNRVALRLEPVPDGTNEGRWLMAMRLETNSAFLEKGDRLNIAVINQSPAGSFIVAFHIAIYAGIVISAPFILYFVASFVFPALRMREKKYVYAGLGWGLGLFFTGVSFCYFVLMPVALTASVQYSEWLGFTAPLWRAEDYIGFVSKFMLGMGVGFELPVVILILARLGIVNYALLAKSRKYVIVINFTLGAILTTPEVITQVLMALPLQLLYELTVWIVWWQERKEKKRQALEEQSADSAK